MFLKVFVLFAFVAVALGKYEALKKKNIPQPYAFGYRTKSEHGTQFRNEKSDGKGRVHGSYGYTDPVGTYREVTYVADHNGFRAEIKTNEHGTSDQDPANIEIESSALNILNDVQNLVVKQPLKSFSSKEKKSARPKYGKYSDVRFFHFGQHSHEEKRESDDGESLNNDEEEVSDDEESKANDEQEGDDEDSEVEQRTMFHRIGRHGGHE